MNNYCEVMALYITYIDDTATKVVGILLLTVQWNDMNNYCEVMALYITYIDDTANKVVGILFLRKVDKIVIITSWVVLF